MDETRLRTIEQLQQFLSATPEVAFKAPPAGSAADNQRYEHISRVLARFDYPQRNKRERGVVLAYLRRTSGYGRAQLTRLVARWAANRVAQHPLVKRYRAPAAPFARKYTAADVELLVETVSHGQPTVRCRLAPTGTPDPLPSHDWLHRLPKSRRLGSVPTRLDTSRLPP